MVGKRAKLEANGEEIGGGSPTAEGGGRCNAWEKDLKPQNQRKRVRDKGKEDQRMRRPTKG